jgi:hypothetical protein
MESLRSEWKVVVTKEFTVEKMYTFTNLLIPDVIGLDIITTTEDDAWSILARILKKNTVKVYITGDYDGNTNVIFSEDAAIETYKQNKVKDNGSWVQVWENNIQLLHDPIFDKI